MLLFPFNNHYLCKNNFLLSKYFALQLSAASIPNVDTFVTGRDIRGNVFPPESYLVLWGESCRQLLCQLLVISKQTWK